MERKISGLLFANFYLLASAAFGYSSEALTLYKDANYGAAIPALKIAIAADGKNALLHAALLSSLAQQGSLDEAWEEAQADESAFGQSVDVMAARGEFAFFLADMAKAQSLFREALKLNGQNARATLGLARVLTAASYFKSARTLILKAHELDEHDALITKYWLRYVQPQERQKALTAEFASVHPWLYGPFQAKLDPADPIGRAFNPKQDFLPDGARREVELNLIDLRDGPKHYRGVGLPLRIDGGHKISLLLDTGARGIVLTQRAVEKLGLSRVGESQSYGIGDNGLRKGFFAAADSCEVDTLTFKNCWFNVLEKDRTDKDTDFDGLIGVDVFEDYLISLDFQKHKLGLKPLAERALTMQGYDREVPADEKDFTPVFRTGSNLFVSTRMNGQENGLFLLDTGSDFSNVDSEFAGRMQKLHFDDSIRVTGVSGQVKRVFEVEKAEIEFAGFRQRNLGMTVFELNRGPVAPQFRTSGILGLPVLMFFRLTIDLRNGLVKFERAVP